jgi:hypothetical protein
LAVIDILADCPAFVKLFLHLFQDFWISLSLAIIQPFAKQQLD